ncbi:MAG: radical SAM protein [Candidatus Aminicenantes bacterium]|nr:radical SAM protein [Candidatus Aminicenantes bacterium]NIM84248.1 radical SAM protein [Candidatus Aminicenantes bacterium]NIN23697.1 radical SAM protein [Candidatus Aminicenantes bacterium]NIN47404.1 radical SAM protein [Candidatus Aminicenantes bacterium]NIN90332.1 radical SAM protein [Candidatus Aminicenantes bacterium]
MDKDKRKPLNLASLLIRIVKVWRRDTFKKVWRLKVLRSGLIRSRRRRKKILRNEGLRVPMGIAFSPTMQCNLTCSGCYARFYPRENELSTDTIDAFISEAETLGVIFCVITGGEPFMRKDMLEICKKHRNILFLIVTNGTYIDETAAREIAESGNILPMLSIEGTAEQTDERRGEGIYHKVTECMKQLQKHGVLFGFSAVLTRQTISTLGSDAFINAMIDLGCSTGFYNELIPMDNADLQLLPLENQRQEFKHRLQRLRKEKPIVLVHLPDDEYNEEDRCLPVANGAVHINSQGYVEPCPFAHFARENIKTHSFRDILRSPFLQAVRSHPTLLKKEKGSIGCSLAGNRELLAEVARQTGATPTDSANP